MKKLSLCMLLVSIMSVVTIYGCSRAGHDHGHDHDHDMPQHSEISSMPLSGKVSGGVREVKITASQFAFEPATVVVKKGEKVKMLVKSTDVMHGIGIDEFKVSSKLPPNEEVVIEFIPDHAGTFPFYCSVFCGAGHGAMHGTLVVRE